MQASCVPDLSQLRILQQPGELPLNSLRGGSAFLLARGVASGCPDLCLLPEAQCPLCRALHPWKVFLFPAARPSRSLLPIQDGT